MKLPEKMPSRPAMLAERGRQREADRSVSGEGLEAACCVEICTPIGCKCLVEGC